MNKKEYTEALLNPLWQQKRAYILNLRRHRCATPECKNAKFLQVHHKSYTRDKMPWEYPDENFVVLCEKCHDKNHAFEYTQKLCESCKKQPVPRLARLCLGCQDSFVEWQKSNPSRRQEKSLLQPTQKLDNEMLAVAEFIADKILRENKKNAEALALTQQLEAEKNLHAEKKSPAGKETQRKAGVWEIPKNPQAEKRSTSGDGIIFITVYLKIILITVCFGFFLQQCVFKEDSPTPPAKEVPPLAVPAPPNQPAPNRPNAVNPPPSFEDIHAQNTHWITISSGIRHNSKCDYYQNSRGRPCTKNEGKACRRCGG